MTNEIATGDLGQHQRTGPERDGASRETDASYHSNPVGRTYWLTAKIDWDGRVDESNEGNNVLSESLPSSCLT